MASAVGKSGETVPVASVVCASERLVCAAGRLVASVVPAVGLLLELAPRASAALDPV